MEEQQPAPGYPSWPQDPTTPMPAQWAPQVTQATDSQYSPYYPPTVSAQPVYAPWPSRQVTPQPARMPKAEAMAVTRKLKAALIAGSVMAFGVLAALAAGHITGVTSQQSGANNATNPNASGSSQQPIPSSSDDGGFFNQGSGNGGNNGGFGVSPNAPGQQPFTSSSTS